MMRLIPFIIALLLCAGAHASTATVQWDIQNGAGADTNGCGNDGTGTDYSQIGATPHKAILTGTTSVTANVITFTDGTTVAAGDVGNLVWVVSGTNMTAGWYLITTVSAGVNGTWTVAGMGPSAVNLPTSGTSTNMVANMGGSCNTLTAVAASLVGPQAGSTVNVKNVGSYSISSTITLGASGTTANGSIFVRGYNSTHGDITACNTLGASSANAPTVTTATNNTNLITSAGASLWLFQGFRFTNTAGTKDAAFARSGGTPRVTFDCVYENGLTTFNSSSTLLTLARSEVAANTTNGISATNDTTIEASWIHGNLGPGVDISSTLNFFMSYSSVDHNTTAGIRAASPNEFVIDHSTIACNAGNTAGTPNACSTSNATDGIAFTTAGAATRAVITNSVLWGNGQYNLNFATTGAVNTFYNNGFGGAGTGNVNTASGVAITTGINPITISVDPFVNSSTGNFAPNSAPTGGAMLRAAGYPGAFPGNASTGYPDIGAVQGGAVSIGGVY